MKRVIALSIFFFFTFTPFLVYADSILINDDFSLRHEERFNYLGRNFVTNGEDGNVVVHDEPGASGNKMILPNGNIINLMHSCLYDGVFWGFTPEYYGWVKMDEMLVLYDYIEFERNHYYDFYPYEGDYAKIKETRSAIIWQWPGSGIPLWTVEDLDTDNLRVINAYMDDDGREWGLVMYLYGGKYSWLCLSDPLNRDIPAFNPMPEARTWKSETKHIDVYRYQQKNELLLIIMITLLVVTLCVSTAVLIRIFWKPDMNKTEGERHD